MIAPLLALVVPQLVMFRIESSPRPGYPRYDIVGANTADRRVHQIVGESRPPKLQPLGALSWSDPSHVAFTVDLERSRGRVSSPTDIYAVDLRSRAVRRVTRTRRAFGPVVAGDRTMAVGLRSERLASSISLFTRDGRLLRRLVAAAPQTRNLPSSWSPDGRLLAFTRLRYQANGTVRRDVYVVDRAGKSVRRILANASDPAWSPDGRQLAFVSDTDRNGVLSYGDREFLANELYVANADGKARRRLTRTRGLNEAAPAWSPDGRMLAYQRGRVVQNAEATGVFLVRAAGGSPTPVAFDPRLATWFLRPAWRPPG